jgi:hypothetical protein
MMITQKHRNVGNLFIALINNSLKDPYKIQILKVSENLKKFPQTREIPRNSKNSGNQNMPHTWGDTFIGLPLAGSVYMHTQSYIFISTCPFLTAN